MILKIQGTFVHATLNINVQYIFWDRVVSNKQHDKEGTELLSHCGRALRNTSGRSSALSSMILDPSNGRSNPNLGMLCF